MKDISHAIKEHAEAVRHVQQDPNSVQGKQRQLETKQALDQAVDEAVKEAVGSNSNGAQTGSGMANPAAAGVSQDPSKVL